MLFSYFSCSVIFNFCLVFIIQYCILFFLFYFCSFFNGLKAQILAQLGLRTGQHNSRQQPKPWQAQQRRPSCQANAGPSLLPPPLSFSQQAQPWPAGSHFPSRLEHPTPVVPVTSPHARAVKRVSPSGFKLALTSFELNSPGQKSPDLNGPGKLRT